MAKSTLICVNCKDIFPREQMTSSNVGYLCSEKCIMEKIRKEKEKQKQKAIQKAYGRDTKGKKRKTKKQKNAMSRTEWYSKLQVLVNQYVVNVRDKLKPCCTCGTTKPNIKYDAGHCFTVKARPDIRFNLKNIHKQCSVQCNQHGSGVRLEYEKFIIKKYGQEQWNKLLREGKQLREQFPHWEDIEKEIVRYRKLLRDNGVRPQV